MTVKGVKLKSESFFSISYGVLELLEENPKGGPIPPPPGPDRVNALSSVITENFNRFCLLEEVGKGGLYLYSFLSFTVKTELTEKKLRQLYENFKANL